MFEAVGIQFGMDQMVEASSDQISAFTHWYYWSMNIGIGIQATALVVCMYLGNAYFLQKQFNPLRCGDNVAVIAEAIMMVSCNINSFSFSFIAFSVPVEEVPHY